MQSCEQPSHSSGLKYVEEFPGLLQLVFSFFLLYLFNSPPSWAKEFRITFLPTKRALTSNNDCTSKLAQLDMNDDILHSTNTCATPADNKKESTTTVEPPTLADQRETTQMVRRALGRVVSFSLCKGVRNQHSRREQWRWRVQRSVRAR